MMITMRKFLEMLSGLVDIAIIREDDDTMSVISKSAIVNDIIIGLLVVADAVQPAADFPEVWQFADNEQCFIYLK